MNIQPYNRGLGRERYGRGRLQSFPAPS